MFTLILLSISLFIIGCLLLSILNKIKYLKRIIYPSYNKSTVLNEFNILKTYQGFSNDEAYSLILDKLENEIQKNDIRLSMNLDNFAHEMQKLAVRVKKKNKVFDDSKPYPESLTFKDIYDTIKKEIEEIQ